VIRARVGVDIGLYRTSHPKHRAVQLIP
jgi:hypothetical protein